MMAGGARLLMEAPAEPEVTDRAALCEMTIATTDVLFVLIFPSVCVVACATNPTAAIA